MLEKGEYLLPLNVGVGSNGKEIISDFSNETSLVLIGQSGSGKTTKIKEIIKEISGSKDINLIDISLVDLDYLSSYKKTYLETECISTYVTNVYGFLNTIEEFHYELEDRKEFLEDNGIESWKELHNQDIIDLKENPWKVLIIDEFTIWKERIKEVLTVEEYESIISKLVSISMEGRSLGIKLIIGSQSSLESYIPIEILSNSSMKMVFSSEDDSVLERTGLTYLTDIKLEKIEYVGDFYFTSFDTLGVVKVCKNQSDGGSEL